MQVSIHSYSSNVGPEQPRNNQQTLRFAKNKENQINKNSRKTLQKSKTKRILEKSDSHKIKRNLIVSLIIMSHYFLEWEISIFSIIFLFYLLSNFMAINTQSKSISFSQILFQLFLTLYGLFQLFRNPFDVVILAYFCINFNQIKQIPVYCMLIGVSIFGILMSFISFLELIILKINDVYTFNIVDRYTNLKRRIFLKKLSLKTFQSHLKEQKYSICLQNGSEYQIACIRLSCSHAYHSKCLRKRLNDNQNCPLCRKKLF